MVKPVPRLPGWLDTAARGVLTAWVALIVLAVRWHPTVPGLDASWAFALNWSAAHGLRHGRDIAFTYGPLSHLTLPFDVGQNLLRGVAFQLMVWGLFSLTVAWAAFARRVPLYRLAGFAVLAAYGVPVFWSYGYSGTDLFLGFWTLLLLGCAAGNGRRWWLFYAAACATAVLAMFVKLSSGLQALSAAWLFAAGLFAVDRARGRRAALLAGIPPVLFAALYLLYCPEPAALARYVRASLEMASGYPAAMSYGDNPGLWAALGIGAAYAVFAAVLWKHREPSTALAVAIFGLLAMEFKHSVVRQHVQLYFYFVPLALAVLLLSTDLRKRDWRALAVPAAVILALWYPHRAGAEFGGAGLRVLADLAHFPQVRAGLAAASQAALENDRLPPAMLARIGNDTVTALPWEVAYAAANPLNFRPLPIFANYQAYTPYLDRWNAEALAGDARAPRFAIFDWVSVDERHPTLEVPATSLALYQHYGLDTVDGARLLLRRRGKPRFTRLNFLGTRQVGLREPLRVPGNAHPVVARIRLRATVTGRLRRLLYRLPEVRVVLFSEGAPSIQARTPPDVLEDGLALNFTPADAAGAAALFERNAGDGSTALSLAGAGLAFYDPIYAVDLYEIPEITLTKPVNGPNPAGLPSRGETDAARIELLNGTGALDIGSGEVAEIPAADYVVIQGWAVDEAAGGPAAAAWLEFDGQMYPARYGLVRPDIAAVRGQAFRNCGFEWTVPAWKLGSTPHRLALKVVSRDGTACYTARRAVQFRLSTRRGSSGS